jgi:outer membrane protein OmpA-like peptidoglycan-associated protein
VTTRWAALAGVAAATIGAACGPKSVRTSTVPADQAIVVLLPDSESGTTGHATVSNSSGSQPLNAARESTTVSPGAAPSAPTVMSEEDVQRMFGDVLAALPPAPVHFTLYYKFDSDELTDESKAMVPRILQAVKDRPTPDVAIIGHTDSTGTAISNVALGMKRAVAVRTLLIDAGLDASSVAATSHGEADPLIPTADNVAEPRNRRVEITVR